MRIAFLLGAGASAQGGCPVMSDFFRAADTLHNHGLLSDLSTEFDAIRDARERLFKVKSKTGIDIENLEQVFNAIEMAIFLEQDFADDQGSDAVELKSALISLIAAVLQRTQASMPTEAPRHIKSTTGAALANESMKVRGPEGYDEFARLTSQLRESAPAIEVGVITFNYDVGLEHALLAHGVPFEYSFGEPNPGHVPIFKLHGSVNWFLEPDGEQVEVQHVDLAWLSTIVRRWPIDAQRRDIKIIDVKEIGCLQRTPLIIPPSESKAALREPLGGMWREASRFLSYADYVAIIGYSLPNTDEFFRQFFNVSMMSDRLVRRVFVANRERADSLVWSRYRELVGPSLLDRLELMSQDFRAFCIALGETHADNQCMLDGTVIGAGSRAPTIPGRR